MPPAEEEGVFLAVQSHTSGSTNPVSDLITDDGTQHDRQEQPF